MERLGRWDPDRWQRRMRPFGVRSVSPRPHKAIIRVSDEFLPDVLRAALPAWAAEHDSPDCAEVTGIAGLRPRHERGCGILARPGFPGRIVVPCMRGLWRKALLVVAAMNDADEVRMPWRSVPDDWHPGETGFADAWPDTYSPTGEWYRNSRFTSRLLRRLPGLCPAPRAEWHDLWVNHFTSSPAVNVEWENGPAHAAALQRLLDPEFGPGTELQLLDGAVRGRLLPRHCGTGKGSLHRATRHRDPASPDSRLARRSRGRLRCLAACRARSRRAGAAAERRL